MDLDAPPRPNLPLMEADGHKDEKIKEKRNRERETLEYENSQRKGENLDFLGIRWKS